MGTEKQEMCKFVVDALKHELSSELATVGEIAQNGTILITPTVSIHANILTDMSDNFYMVTMEKLSGKKRVFTKAVIAGSECPFETFLQRALGSGRQCGDDMMKNLQTSITIPDDVPASDIETALRNKILFAYGVDAPKTLFVFNHYEVMQAMRQSDAIAYFDNTDGSFHLVPTSIKNGLDKRLWSVDDIKHMFG